MGHAKIVEQFSIRRPLPGAFTQKLSGAGMVPAFENDDAEDFGCLRIVWGSFAGFGGVIEGFWDLALRVVKSREPFVSGNEQRKTAEHGLVRLAGSGGLVLPLVG